MIDIVEKLFDLFKQHPDSYDHDYLKRCIKSAVFEILHLRKELKEAQVKLHASEVDNEKMIIH